MKKFQPTLSFFNFQKFVKTAQGTQIEAKIPNVTKVIVCNECNKTFKGVKYLKGSQFCKQKAVKLHGNHAADVPETSFNAIKKAWKQGGAKKSATVTQSRMSQATPQNTKKK